MLLESRFLLFCVNDAILALCKYFLSESVNEDYRNEFLGLAVSGSKPKVNLHQRKAKPGALFFFSFCLFLFYSYLCFCE
jgi:hypothetical protein